MRYISTRGRAPAAGFAEVMLSGLAPDGGLYMPESWPHFSASDLMALRDLPYPQLVARLVAPFLDDSVTALDELAEDAYASFERLAPQSELGDGLRLLELFWGPTLAFKDYALQLLGRLFDQALTARGIHAVVLGATSGDTGSAAIEACRDRAALDVVILHPHERVSEVQRRQMTTVLSPNVHNVAVRGTFDDCQRLVKGMLADSRLRSELHLTSANSINWVRVMAQVAYYFFAALQSGASGGEVSFAVPTGNFGNVFAGYVARKMGLPVRRFVIGTNKNNVVAQFVRTGRLSIDTVVPTITPAMDIQVPSNLERLLFDLYDRDGDAVRGLMDRFAESGRVEVPAEKLSEFQAVASGLWLDDDATRHTIDLVYRDTGTLVDPHTAVGIAAGKAAPREPHIPMICIGTAHPAKFPEAVEQATGVRPHLPSRLTGLLEWEERMAVLPAEPHALEAFVGRVGA